MKRMLIYLLMLCTACGQSGQRRSEAKSRQKHADDFGTEVAFLKQHVETIVLKDSTSNAAIAIVPAWQGRVMTSTVSGNDSRSLGWINHDLIATGKPQPKMNAFGGEDRFWLGPEGGQNGFYFAPGDTFDYAHWQVPAPLDTEAFRIIHTSRGSVSFEKDMQLINHKGNTFHIKVTRTVTLIARKDIRNYIGMELPRSVDAVAWHSSNNITNTGQQRWDTAYGMPSIRIPGMFRTSAKSTVMIPLRQTGEGIPPVNDHYFGKVPEDRLRIKGHIAYFKADAKSRSKIGVSQPFCYNYFGSYDAEHRVLTIVQFTMPTIRHRYVNSAWAIQNEPFGGDVLNVYNDGPPGEDLTQLGEFYEMESSSPAAFLKPGAQMGHYHRTIHLSGTVPHLDPIMKKWFGVSIKEVIAAM